MVKVHGVTRKQDFIDPEFYLRPYCNGAILNPYFLENRKKQQKTKT